MFIVSECGGWNGGPPNKHVHVLSPGTWECDLTWSGVFADGIKDFKSIRMKGTAGSQVEPGVSEGLEAGVCRGEKSGGCLRGWSRWERPTQSRRSLKLRMQTMGFILNALGSCLWILSRGVTLFDLHF